MVLVFLVLGLPWWLSWSCLQCGRPGFDPWVGKILWRRKWQTHSSTPAWKIPWTEENGGLQSTGSQRVGQDWATSLSLSCFRSFHLMNEIKYISIIISYGLFLNVSKIFFSCYWENILKAIISFRLKYSLHKYPWLLLL